jgi:hypothetical protein
MLSQSSRWSAIVVGAAALFACLAMTCPAAFAQDENSQDEKPSGAEAKSPPGAGAEDSLDELSLAQEQIRAKYQRFEQVLLRMSELTAASDPNRAALLRKAVGQSKEKLIGLQFERLVEVLKQERLANAVTQQNTLEEDLAGLLELLLTEQRSQKLKDERERVKEQIRRLTELINKQQQLQGQTAGDVDAKRLADDQEKLRQQTGKLAGEMAPDENGGKPKPGDQSEAESQDQGKPQGKAKSSDGGKPKPGKGGDEADREKRDADREQKSDGKKKSDDDQAEKSSDQGADSDKSKKPGDEKGAGEKPEGEPAESEPSEVEPSDSSEQNPSGKKSPSGQPQGKAQPSGKGQQGEDQGGGEEQPPQQEQEQPEQSSQESARQRVEAARKRMESARKKLEQAQRKGALGEQEQAIRELELAKAKLEDILRQLREEEMQRTLALLEARFRKMLEMQTEVYDATKLLAGQPAEERDRNDEIEAGRLSRKESQIVIEVDSALSVLHEEGSAVAFPEAVTQMREDMEQVAARLAQAKADEITVGIEEEIIAALEEMIAALQKAQKDQEEKQQQQQGQNQQGEQQEPPLVDSLAELKMIRSLQMRVNQRTERYSKLVEGEEGQADKADLIDALQKLSERETRIFKATRDIVLGKNK